MNIFWICAEFYIPCMLFGVLPLLSDMGQLINYIYQQYFSDFKITEKIWSDEQCRYSGHASRSVETPNKCWEMCKTKEECSAVNYHTTNGECVFRDCALPVPEPQWANPSYQGVTAISGWVKLLVELTQIFSKQRCAESFHLIPHEKTRHLDHYSQIRASIYWQLPLLVDNSTNLFETWSASLNWLLKLAY